MVYHVNFRGVIQFREFWIVLKVPAIVDHVYFLSWILWHSYNTFLSMIDALAPLSSNSLILSTLEFLFSSKVPELILEFI